MEVHLKGCTYTALKEIAKELEKENIETEIFQLGNKPIAGCIDVLFAEIQGNALGRI